MSAPHWKSLLLSFVFGGLWAGLAWAYTGDSTGGTPAGDVAPFAGPPIGLLVYLVSRWAYQRPSLWPLVGWTILTCALAVALYGAVWGALNYYLDWTWKASLAYKTASGALMLLAGFFGIFWPFVPVAFAFHLALRECDRQAAGKKRSPAPAA